MLGGHERDRRRARPGLSLSGASLTIRHGVPASLGEVDWAIYPTLAPPRPNTGLLVTLIIAAAVVAGGRLWPARQAGKLAGRRTRRPPAGTGH